MKKRFEEKDPKVTLDETCRRNAIRREKRKERKY
jgi:hypothetical protein